jgi:hypothetical protein
MPTFSTASRADVVPKQQTKGPSQRTIIHEHYVSALRDALDAGQALVIELEPDDKEFTIKNRINRAVKTLGREDLTVRRRGDQLVAYSTPGESED